MIVIDRDTGSGSMFQSFLPVATVHCGAARRMEGVAEIPRGNGIIFCRPLRRHLQVSVRSASAPQRP
jgi:hypothetical protein